VYRLDHFAVKGEPLDAGRQPFGFRDDSLSNRARMPMADFDPLARSFDEEVLVYFWWVGSVFFSLDKDR
jgi:hypothetical protein